MVREQGRVGVDGMTFSAEVSLQLLEQDEQYNVKLKDTDNVGVATAWNAGGGSRAASPTPFTLRFTFMVRQYAAKIS